MGNNEKTDITVRKEGDGVHVQGNASIHDLLVMASHIIALAIEEKVTHDTRAGVAKLGSKGLEELNLPGEIKESLKDVLEPSARRLVTQDMLGDVAKMVISNQEMDVIKGSHEKLFKKITEVAEKELGVSKSTVEDFIAKGGSHN